MTSGDSLLQVDKVSRSFGGYRAVDDVTLNVRSGGIHALIGPNGAGKSTLFNLITGHLRPNSGSIRFGGRSIAGLPPYKVARHGLARAFQITSVFPEMSVAESLGFAVLSQRGQALGLRPRALVSARTEALRIAESVGLADYAEVSAITLSHGDQRALEVGLALALRPRLLLLDEPTAGMAPGETDRMNEMIQRLSREHGTTILFCEHDMRFVFALAQTITVMHHGSILIEGAPEAVRSDATVQEVYLGSGEL